MPKTAIHPTPRLEGHEKIELFLDDDGRVKEAYWKAEQGGFERFCLGRPIEEVPRIAPSICGRSFLAHHLAAIKALDDLYGVEPPPAARLIREMALNASYLEEYVRPLFFSDASLKAIEVRRINRKIMNHFFGRASHPEGGLPGGVSKGPGRTGPGLDPGSCRIFARFCPIGNREL